MAEKIETIKTLLDELRNPTMKNKKHFADFLPDAWRLFGLKDNPDLISLEAFLIYATLRWIGIETDKYKIGKISDIDKETAQKHDSYLLALGLLKGYYHTKDDGTNYLASERHKQYLKDVNFVAIKYPKPEPSFNLDINDSESRPRRVLSTADKRCREDLSEYLSDTKRCQEYLEEGKRKFITPNANCINLPEPLYTLENFPPDIDIEQGVEQEQNTEQEQKPDETPRPEPKSRGLLRSFVVTFLQFIKKRSNDVIIYKRLTIKMAIIILVLLVFLIKNRSDDAQEQAKNIDSCILIPYFLKEASDTKRVTYDCYYDESGNLIGEKMVIEFSDGLSNMEEVLEDW